MNEKARQSKCDKDGTIQLPTSGIEIDIANGIAVAIRSDLRIDCPHCSQPNCFFDCELSQADDSQETELEARERLEKNRAYDGIESLILALVGAGINVESPAFLEGVEEAVEAVENNI